MIGTTWGCQVKAASAADDSGDVLAQVVGYVQVPFQVSKHAMELCWIHAVSSLSGQ